MKRLLLCMFAIGCGTDTPGPGGECVVGATQPCACTGGGTGVATCTADKMFGACEQCPPPDPDPSKVNFHAQVVPIFQKSCGSGQVGCHARDAFAATFDKDCRGWLSLEDASLGSVIYAGAAKGQSTGCPDMTLYRRLTTLFVWQCPGSVPYIKASDPARSYLMNKINGTNLCETSPGTLSDQMPPPPPKSNYAISAADKALIQQWIVEGALDN
jgi:hypothetical protein